MSTPTPRLTVEAEPFIPYVPEDEVVRRLGPVVGPYMKRMGFLPNALKLYAHRPEIAEALFRLNSLIMRDPSSTLDQFLKRKLAAIASKANGCTYCTAHSCAMLKAPRGPAPEGWGLERRRAARDPLGRLPARGRGRARLRRLRRGGLVGPVERARRDP